MLKELTTYQEAITLIPDSGIQFLDFGFSLSAISRVSRRFWGEVDNSQTDESGASLVTLHPLFADEEGELRYIDPKHPEGRLAPDDDNRFSINAERALSRFNRQWAPFPYLRRRGQEQYDEGPTTWSRVHVAKLDEPDEHGNDYRVSIAFDTLVAERLTGAPYAAPEHTPKKDPDGAASSDGWVGDVVEDVVFGVPTKVEQLAYFLGLRWIGDWLRETYARGVSIERGRPVDPADLQYPGEHWAAYIVLLDVLNAGLSLPLVRLADIYSPQGGIQPVKTSLVLDIGNSRTCGVFVEERRGAERIDVSDTYRLELRDLGAPERICNEPFESRVEFAAVDFGPLHHAKKSGRTGRDAFWWPSPLRVGPEAARLAAGSDGTEGASGLSSPKRYLWDVAKRETNWVNNRVGLPTGQPVPGIRGPIVALLTEAGEPVSRRQGEFGLFPKFSRSSLYTLMLCELLIHAVSQVNSAGSRMRRANAQWPRQLSHIIFTLPSATPVAEQKIMRQRVRDAVDLVWEVFGWSERAMPKPKIKLDWDEAACTHLVYLFNEMNQKQRRSPREYFSALGRGRQGQHDGPALRIASMDMGGGTTDLMIMQHEVEGDGIVHPVQVFREGFRLAGDDILKGVIEDCLAPELVKSLGNAGVSNAAGMLADLLGGDRVGMGQQERAARARFVGQVLRPAAIAALKAYEKTEPRDGEEITVTLNEGDVSSPSGGAGAYIEQAARRAGAADFKIDGMEITLAASVIDDVISSIVTPMLTDLCDVIREFDCDRLLLSGRPSQFPAIRRIISSSIPVTPDRIVAMGDYKVENWYPFRSSDFRIQDPKTTAVVGAMLCQLCEQGVEQFTMRSSEIKMRSTAKYLGLMGQNDQIKTEHELLKNVDLTSGQGVVSFTFPMFSPAFIGYRQLPIERWKTTPLYFVYFKNPERVPKLNLPLSVCFVRADATDDAGEEVMEDFSLDEALDANGDPVHEVAWRLQTLRTENQSEAGYWIDSGVLNITSL